MKIMSLDYCHTPTNHIYVVPYNCIKYKAFSVMNALVFLPQLLGPQIASLWHNIFGSSAALLVLFLYIARYHKCR